MSIWIQKYRPKTLDELVCTDDTRAKLLEFVTNKEMPSILLSSAHGRGKTSLAKLLTDREYGLLRCDVLHVDCSIDRSIDVVREKIVNFASGVSLKGLKVIICDEADGFTPDAQRSLKGVIEKYEEKTRFIFTTNHIDKIIPELKSRLTFIDVTNPPKLQVLQRCLDILRLEAVEYVIEDVKSLVNQCYPDIRETIKNLQAGVIDGIFHPNTNRELLINIDETLPELLLANKSKGDKYNEIYQLFVDSKLKDYDLVYRILFRKISLFKSEYRPNLTIIIADYMKQSVTSPSKEITVMACLSKIINTLQ